MKGFYWLVIGLPTAALVAVAGFVMFSFYAVQDFTEPVQAEAPRKEAPVAIIPRPVLDEHTVEQSMIDLTNDYRQKQSLATLSKDDRLMASAQLKADDLCARDYFSHVDPDGNVPRHVFNQAGYPDSWIGENLAKGYDSPEKAFNGLVRSPTHLANVVGHYIHIGVGFKYCKGTDTRQSVMVVHYGRPV